MFWGAKDFGRNFTKRVRKNIGSLFVRTFSHEDRFWMKKSFHVILHTLGANFFKIKQRWEPFLPRFSGILQRFSQILRRFTQIFVGFSRILP